MTPRQRLLAVFAGQRPDVMPWFCDLSYWHSANRALRNLPSWDADEDGFIQMHADYHVGYYLYGGAPYSSAHDGVKTETQTVDGRTYVTWRTPVGEISGTQQWLPQTYSTAWTQWPCRTPEDLRVVRYIAESRQFTPQPQEWDRVAALAGERGLPMVLPVRSPVSAMLAEWSGATNLSYLLADARETLEATLVALGESEEPLFDILADCPAPLIEFPDNLTGEIVTGLFERYQADWYVHWLAKLHAAGKQVGTHIDGTLHGIMPAVIRCGMDFIESVTPKPCGDVEIEDLRDLAGDRVILWGGVPGAMFAPPFTRDDVRRHVERIVEAHWDSGRFVLGSADQVPPNGDIELVRYIGELLEELCA